MSASALYTGRVTHVRHAPKRHAFSYRLYMLYLDLDELPTLAPSPLFGVERARPLSFRRRDYLGDRARPLKEAVLDEVERALGERPPGPVRLLTHVRAFGYVFNPVSFYYCFDPDGESLRAVVAEITNTPWGERHRYVVRGARPGATARFPKAFHVSPFFPMTHTYDWSFSAPGERLVVGMTSEQDGRTIFQAGLTMARRPLSTGQLARVAVTLPLVGGLVHAAIYAQALRLWLKRAPFFPHPTPAVGEAEELAMNGDTRNLALARLLPATTSLAERLVGLRLERLTEGVLEIETRGRLLRFGRPAADDLAAKVTVLDERGFWQVLFGGTLGAGEAFMDETWVADDLTKLLRIFVRNADALERFELGASRFGNVIAGLRHSLRRNTKTGSRRNIADHYDLGNDFFQLMLDPTLTYSAAIFERPTSTLEEASVHKLDLLCRKLELSHSDHLLEIGSGWGSLALHAAERYGCQVTTTTVSREQHALAIARVRERGLADRITVLNADYRELRGRFDKIVSCEMIEAIGREFYPAFFRQCDQLLEPRGKLALQAITIRDQRFERASRETEFIKRYIFPGSCMPSTTALLQAATEASTLTLRGFEDYTPHYARTMAEWRANLVPHKAKVVAQFGDRFWRMWDYYLAYCEAGFLERYIASVQLVFARPSVE